ncbi:hypothetical protein AB0M20_36795 [Actinoplanes sp. NPDC051633]|uniref:hypothetical protein n=1 Tax=Actinoplanes sp. NPDC051633 TaxID=3155670 RepID=UPI003439DBE1
MAVDTSIDGKRDVTAAYLDRRLLRGSAVLLTGGFLMWLAGATVGAVAVASGCRRYVGAMDESPAHVARRRWAQMRSATSAGTGAWREYDQHVRPHVGQ